MFQISWRLQGIITLTAADMSTIQEKKRMHDMTIIVPMYIRHDVIYRRHYGLVTYIIGNLMSALCSKYCRNVMSEYEKSCPNVKNYVILTHLYDSVRNVLQLCHIPTNFVIG